MSKYNDNWKAFVDETKEMSDEQLQEYVGDIMRAIGGLSSQSGQGDQYSGLSGLGTVGSVKASDARKKAALANNIKNMLNKVEKDLSDAGVEGDVLNGIMEAIRADLAAGGYEFEPKISENTENKAFQLINTIQAIEKVADLAIRDKVKEIILKMFSKNKIELDPDSSKALAQPSKPSRIDTIRPPRSTRDIKGSEKYKKFMTNLLNFFANEMKMDTKIAKKIVYDIWKQTPPSGNFNKLIFLEAIDKEIDIASILAKSGLSPVQQVKVLGALKKWAAQNSDLVDDRMTKILRQRNKDDDKITKALKQRN